MSIWFSESFPNIFTHPGIDFFRVVSHGHGCVATTNIHRGELIASIRYSDCIVAEDETDLMEEIFNNFNNNGCRFGKYIHKVVESGVLDVVPVVWENRDEFERVGSLKWLMKAVEHVRDMPRWVTAYMLSRSFSHPDGIATVPLADMFNHSTLNWNTRIREMEDSYVFYAERDIVEGEEVLSNYGDEYDVMSMMVTHGFVDDGMSEGRIYFENGIVVDVDKELVDGVRLPAIINVSKIENILVRKLAEIENRNITFLTNVVEKKN